MHNRGRADERAAQELRRHDHHLDGRNTTPVPDGSLPCFVPMKGADRG
jgi:hypothetical protein